MKGKLFYCSVEEHSGGIWERILDTPKSFKLKRLDNDGGRSYFGKDDIITQKKDNNCRNTWRDYGDWFVIYPNACGIPYSFEPLTEEHLKYEINHCERFMVSDKFYKDLLDNKYNEQ